MSFGGDGGVGKAMQEMTKQMQQQQLNMMEMQNKFLQSSNQSKKEMVDLIKQLNTNSAAHLQSFGEETLKLERAKEQKQKGIEVKHRAIQEAEQSMRDAINREEEVKVQGRKKNKKFFDYFSSALVA